jgi:hypothetical protein
MRFSSLGRPAANNRQCKAVSVMAGILHAAAAIQVAERPDHFRFPQPSTEKSAPIVTNNLDRGYRKTKLEPCATAPDPKPDRPPLQVSKLTPYSARFCAQVLAAQDFTDAHLYSAPQLDENKDFTKSARKKLGGGGYPTCGKTTREARDGLLQPAHQKQIGKIPLEARGARLSIRRQG